MKLLGRSMWVWVVPASSWILGAASVRAQDAVKVAPDNYKVVLENDHVRVCDLHVKPGEKIPMHSHPEHVVYVLAEGQVKLDLPDGKSKEPHNKLGSAIWIGAETHSGENIGKTEFHGLVVELKDPADLSAKHEIMKEVPGHATVLLENERVRVIETVLKPGEESAMHSHPAYVIYSMQGGKMKFTDPEGKTTERTLPGGMAVWSEPVTHSVTNIGTTDSRVLNFEIKGLTTKAEAKPKDKP